MIILNSGKIYDMHYHIRLPQEYRYILELLKYRILSIQSYDGVANLEYNNS